MTEDVFRVAICDDTPMEAELLAARLREYGQGPGRPPVRVHTHGSAEALGEALNAGQGCDLIFMDIVLPGQDGLAFVRARRGQGQVLPVVFLTNSPEYDGEARALGALACLLKPVKREALFAVLDARWRAVAQSPPAPGEPLAAEDSSRFSAGEIVYAEWRPGGVHCHLAGGRTAVCAADAPGLARWLAQKNVARLGRELAVDMDRIASFAPKGITMAGGAYIKVPWTKQREWAARYMDYVAGR